MEKYIRLIESKYLKKDIPKFNAGDTVDVEVKIVEEGKTRLQTFEGVVIARAGSGTRETFTVRKMSYGEGVEIVFPLHSPSIERIEVVKKGNVKRAKLYYLKKKVGKETKVEEKIDHTEATAAGAETPTPTPTTTTPPPTTPPPREEAK